MKAEEARAKTDANAAAIAAKKAAAAAKKAEASKNEFSLAKRKFYADEVDSISRSIDTAVEYGESEVQRTYASESMPVDAEKKFKAHRFYPEIIRIKKRFSRRGYKVTIDTYVIEHDESAAYMNSGGECGSMTTWYTHDVIMKIAW